MSPIAITSFVVILGLLVLMRRAGLVSAADAQAYLKQGAMVIDVRSAGEYTAGHLPQAVNIPLSEIETVIERKVGDKNRLLLLHCASGARSGAAKARLKVLGYDRVYNLGGYGRAEKIVKSRG